jgi:hypothetical protein
MKSIFGIIGLLLVLAIVGFQMKSNVKALAPAPEQIQTIQTTVKDQVNAAMQAARPDADDKAATEGKWFV